MAQASDRRLYTSEEYLEQEVNSSDRHEYLDGEIILMTGGTPNHNKIAGNFYAALNFALKRQPYDVFVTDQRLWIPATRLYTYPDVMVVSQPLTFAEGRRDTLTNPCITAEVLSKSTRSYDKDTKFAAYRTIPSFQEYILIDQYALHVEHYIKTDARKWVFLEYEAPTDVLILSAVSFQIELIEIYNKVDFNADE